MSELGKQNFERHSGEEALANKPSGPSSSLTSEVLNAVNVGIIAWSAEARCTLLNHPALSLLELAAGTLRVGAKFEDFLKEEIGRGVIPAEDAAHIMEQIKLRRPFTYLCELPSGEQLQAFARPMRGGGFVVTLIDRGEAKRAIAAANDARTQAEAAELAATEILEQERARQRSAELLAQMDEWLQSCKTIDELYEILTAFMMMAMPGTRGQLFTYSNSRDVLELACKWNCTDIQEHMTPDSCWALRRGRLYTFDPTQFGFTCDHVKEIRGDDDARPSSCIPVIAHGETVGLLHVELQSNEPNSDLPRPFAFARRCAEHISLAIANVQLRDELQDQSTRDPLTSLYNRRHFLEAIRREINRAASTETSFGLLSFDADHFKTFNDKFGHDAGDAVLEGIADRMRALDYTGAVPCRVGGEEFAIILPGADRTRATKSAEDLREAIEHMRVKYIGGALPKVTVSIGISIYPSHGTEPMDLIKQADLALYQAKEAGRNCLRMCDGLDLITF